MRQAERHVRQEARTRPQSRSDTEADRNPSVAPPDSGSVPPCLCGHSVLVRLVGVLGALLLTTAPAFATRIEDLTRLAGDRENKLIGLGLVVGLPGTGDGKDFVPAIRSLQQLMLRLGYEAVSPAELKDTVNVAVVTVSATLPAFAREGDKLDVFVTAAGAATSLRGGRLLLTPLQGPRENSAVYALAEGPLSVEDPAAPTAAKIVGGAILEEEFKTEFVKDGAVTFVLDRDNANFTTATQIASIVNEELAAEQVAAGEGPLLAVALDKAAVKVTIPLRYRASETLVPFISRLQRLPVLLPNTPATVVVNERTGTIVITGDVEVSPALIAHKNLVVAMGGQDRAVADVRPLASDRADQIKLQALVDLWSQLKAEPRDLIAIIKELKRAGKLHAQLVTE
jgi:flagellar P-ring protein precursor FlgI